MSDNLLQLALAAFGLSALALAYVPINAARQWSPFVGLAGQPFWFAFALRTDAWGLSITAGAFTALYLVDAIARVLAWRRRRSYQSALAASLKEPHDD